MDEKIVREAVTLYANDTITESEAARLAGLPRAKFRHYARTSGVVTSSPVPKEQTKMGNQSRG